MKKYFLPIICVAAIQTYAQQEVKGIIQYTNQTPVALADVVISQGDKIVDEISTDENGHFSVVLEEGSYTFKIEEAGVTLHSVTLQVTKNADLGVILVPKTENVTLTEAVVTGQKKLVEKKTPAALHIAVVIAAPEGIAYLKEHLPSTCHLWIGAIDEKLNEKSYIVPGLGDAGDLAYGPKL